MKEAFYWSHIDPFGIESFESVAKTILASSFVARSSAGFLVEKRSRDEVVGSYVEKRIIRDKIQDPLGDEVATERVTFEYLPFRVKASEPNFEFVGAPRLHARFFGCLNPAFTHYFVEARIRFDVESFLEQLARRFSNIEVATLRIEGLLLRNRTLCGIEFRSSMDVRADARALLKKNKVQVNYAKVRLETSEERLVDLEIWRSGKLVTALRRDSPTFDVFRDIVAAQRGLRTEAE